MFAWWIKILKERNLDLSPTLVFTFQRSVMRVDSLSEYVNLRRLLLIDFHPSVYTYRQYRYPITAAFIMTWLE